MKKSTFIVLAIGAIIGIVAYKVLWTVAEPKIEHKIAEIGLTDNEKAANGPLPGEVRLYAEQLAVQNKIPTPGYYSSLNGAEIADAQRSGVFPAARFLGSHDSPNEVYAWRSEDDYEACSFICNRRPGELYIVGGDNPPYKGTVPPGPFLSKADATAGKEIWRTSFDNANASKNFIAGANLNILPNGNIAFAWTNQIALVDGDTGLILKQNTLPTGDTPPEDSFFKHLTIAPDGTLICKNQTRPVGSTYQGTVGIIMAAQEGKEQPNSHLVAVHPETLEILHHIPLPEPATVPHSITMFDEKIAIYIGMDSGCRRVFWNPDAKKLTIDDSWHMTPVQEGQTTADAPTVIGEWIALQTNGLGSEVKASSVAVAHSKDSSKQEIIFPFGELKKGEHSWAPPKCCGDVDNSMIYSADMGVGKIAGIKIDQTTGKLETKFVLDQMSTTFQPMVGPKDKRVLVLTNMKPNVKHESAMLMFMTANYTEQVTWHDSLTGRTLAESDFFDPLTVNCLVTPGYGGRFYYPTKKGFITLQVMPKGK